MSKPNILLIDDDATVQTSLQMLFERAGFKVVAAAGPQAAKAAIERLRPDLIIQDMNFTSRTDGEEGLALLTDLKVSCTGTPVILMTAWASIDLAVNGMKQGAADFVAKPWSNRYLLELVRTHLHLTRAGESKTLSRQALDQAGDFSGIIGHSLALRQTLQTILKVAKTNAPVIISGESGTGKELVAEAIHKNSKRPAQPLVKVNLGSIPQTLFEAEMFGHRKGAFTDAKEDRQGYFATANTGTLFLDEIGELDKASQVKLLRTLQDQTFQPLGSSRTEQIDVRVISATNRNLQQMIREGSFREDLYYRIQLIQITLPPLRERSEDILPLAQHFITQAATEYGKATPQLSTETQQWLVQQPWPGNIRELQQAVKRAVLMSDGSALAVQDFQIETPDTQDVDGLATDMTLDEMERYLIKTNLEKHNGNLSQVAKKLGISRTALYRRLEKYGLKT